MARWAVGCGAPSTPLFLPHLAPVQYITYQHICLAVLTVRCDVARCGGGAERLALSFFPPCLPGIVLRLFSPLIAYSLPILITWSDYTCRIFASLVPRTSKSRNLVFVWDLLLLLTTWSTRPTKRVQYILKRCCADSLRDCALRWQELRAHTPIQIPNNTQAETLVSTHPVQFNLNPLYVGNINQPLAVRHKYRSMVECEAPPVQSRALQQVMSYLRQTRDT